MKKFALIVALIFILLVPGVILYFTVSSNFSVLLPNIFKLYWLNSAILLLLFGGSFLLLAFFFKIRENAQKRSIIKKCSLTEDAFVKVSMHFDDTFENRKRLIAIIESLRKYSGSLDESHIFEVDSPYIRPLLLLNAGTDMSDFLTDLILSTGSDFYMLLDDKKLFLCVKTKNNDVVYKEDVTKEPNLEFYIEEIKKES